MTSGPVTSVMHFVTASKNATRLSDSPPFPLPAVTVTTLSGPYCRIRKSSASPSSMVSTWMTPKSDDFFARSIRSRSTGRHCRITEISYPVSTFIV